MYRCPSQIRKGNSVSAQVGPHLRTALVAKSPAVISPHATYTVCGLVDGDCEAVLFADVCSRQTCGPSSDDADGPLLDRDIHGQDGVGNSGQARD